MLGKTKGKKEEEREEEEDKVIDHETEKQRKGEAWKRNTMTDKHTTII